MHTIQWAVLAAFSLGMVSPVLAGDANTSVGGSIEARDANQGAGTQTNADDWVEISNALAGPGAQAVYNEQNANTGSGSQDNSRTFQDAWHDIDNANVNSGAQVLDSTNSNGGNRTSSDIVLTLGENVVVANGALEASISGNSVSAPGAGGHANSGLSIGDGSGFRGFAGVSAIALSSGHNSSQNVSVNVTASVTASLGDSYAVDAAPSVPQDTGGIAVAPRD